MVHGKLRRKSVLMLLINRKNCPSISFENAGGQEVSEEEEEEEEVIRFFTCLVELL